MAISTYYEVPRSSARNVNTASPASFFDMLIQQGDKSLDKKLLEDERAKEWAWKNKQAIQAQSNADRLFKQGAEDAERKNAMDAAKLQMQSESDARTAEYQNKVLEKQIEQAKNAAAHNQWQRKHTEEQAQKAEDEKYGLYTGKNIFMPTVQNVEKEVEEYTPEAKGQLEQLSSTLNKTFNDFAKEQREGNEKAWMEYRKENDPKYTTPNDIYSNLPTKRVIPAPNELIKEYITDPILSTYGKSDYDLDKEAYAKKEEEKLTDKPKPLTKVEFFKKREEDLQNTLAELKASVKDWRDASKDGLTDYARDTGILKKVMKTTPESIPLEDMYKNVDATIAQMKAAKPNMSRAEEIGIRTSLADKLVEEQKKRDSIAQATIDKMSKKEQAMFENELAKDLAKEKARLEAQYGGVLSPMEQQKLAAEIKYKLIQSKKLEQEIKQGKGWFDWSD